jgi:SPP1 gp7 family putative phage head morphogenesis protein
VANLYDQAQEFRAALLRDERRAARQMFDVYGAAFRRIVRERESVLAAIAQSRNAGVPDTDIPALLYREGRLQVLQSKVVTELTRFAEQADVIVGGAIDLARVAGDEHAAALMQLALPEGITVAPSGDVDPATGAPRITPVVPEEVGLARGAAQQIGAFTQTNAPVGQLFAQFGPEAAKTLTDAITSGVIAGKNPRVIARDMRQALGGSLTRALTIARTETLRAYREASRAAYQANADVLQGWVWTADLSNRTCPSCWAQHGSVHPLDEVMATHPRCRCSMVPKTKSWRELGFGEQPGGLDIEPGPAAFRKLPEADQRRILGPSKYDAYKRREITLPDLVAKRESPTWGPSTGEASLRVAKDNAALRKAGGGTPPPALPDVVLPPPPPSPVVNQLAEGLLSPADTVDLFTATRGVKKETLDDIKRALDAIGEVVRVPPGQAADRISVKYVGRANYAGQYGARVNILTREVFDSELRMAGNFDGRAGTFVHEYGHYLDMEMMGDATRGIDEASELWEWWQVVKGSRNYGEIRASSTLGARRKAYFLGADECFARSFAQYIARKSGSGEILDDVFSAWQGTERRHGFVPQWDEADFAPIEAALDALFRKRGWLR